MQVIMIQEVAKYALEDNSSSDPDVGYNMGSKLQQILVDCLLTETHGKNAL